MGDLLLHCEEKTFELNHDTFLKSLIEIIPLKSVIKNGAVYIPDWDMTIRGDAENRNGVMVLNYYISCMYWDQEVYECCSGLGATEQAAFLLAQRSFANGMLSVIKDLMNKENAGKFDSLFDTVPLHFSLYKSGIGNMGIGAKPSAKDGVTPPSDPDEYWNLLGEKIKQRLGKQRVNYIKVFASKNNDHVIGECRINDIVSPELSKILYDYAEPWNTENFFSQKLFFFCCQETGPYPYSVKQINEYTVFAIDLFDKLYDSNNFCEDYHSELSKKTGDAVLSESFYSFLPELAAENAFPHVQYPETVQIKCAGTTRDFYKTQLADYCAVQAGLTAALNNGRVGNEAYKKMILYSASYGSISEAKEKGVNIENGDLRLVSLCFELSDTYIVR
jgi:hypothetical protein